jgi:transcriptional regulator with XRE-family HTH domain
MHRGGQVTKNKNEQELTHKIRTFANDLRFERRQRRLSRKDVGRLIGKSAHMVRRYERGTFAPPLATALKLQILYRTQLASIYQPLYAQLTADMRAAEERMLAARGKRGAA